MKQIIAAALLTLSLAGIAQAETSQYSGRGLPGWAVEALTPKS